MLVDIKDFIWLGCAVSRRSLPATPSLHQGDRWGPPLPDTSSRGLTPSWAIKVFSVACPCAWNFATCCAKANELSSDIQHFFNCFIETVNIFCERLVKCPCNGCCSVTAWYKLFSYYMWSWYKSVVLFILTDSKCMPLVMWTYEFFSIWICDINNIRMTFRYSSIPIIFKYWYLFEFWLDPSLKK